MSSARSAGFAVGIMVGIILVVCLFRLANKDGKTKSEYDERQKLIRGCGYKYGFFAMTVVEALMMCFSACEVKLPVTGVVLHFLGIYAGVLVQISYCVWKDAYWALNNDPKRYMVIFLLTGILNFVIPLTSGGIVAGGSLQSGFVNFLCGVLFLIVGIELLLKHLRDVKHDRDGE